MDMKELLAEMDRAYYRLETKQAEVVYALFHRIFHIESNWCSGHYYQKDDGQWHTTAYPIPVISVKGLCDIQIHFDRIVVCTKMKQAAALAYSFEKIRGYVFSVYSADDPFSEYYHEGQSIQELKNNLLASAEKEIEFSFLFPFDTRGKDLFAFVKLLRREGFYQ